MRIRKNKKMSEMGYEDLHSTYDCRLNQSPWDALSFFHGTSPSSLNLLQNSDNSDGNWLSAFCASARLETSEDVNEMAARASDTTNSNRQKDRRESARETGKEGEFRWNNNSDKKCVRCEKIDSCCCCRFNFSFNNHHHKQVRRSFLAIKRRAREANKFQSSNSRTNGFYYYSGFGPLWSKKR